MRKKWYPCPHFTAAENKRHIAYFKLLAKANAVMLEAGYFWDWLAGDIIPVTFFKIPTINSRIKQLENYRDILISSRMTCQPKERWLIDWQLEETITELIKLCDRRSWDRRAKRAAKNPDKFQESRPTLEQIRAIPITKLLDITPQRPTKCLWHNDNRPSLRLHPKNNYVHCFACGKTASVIDVYMALNNCEVGEAIKSLSHLV